MITTTEETKALNKALLAAQKSIEAVKKDAKNPHFKSTYASLSSVLDAVKAPLNENGILITQSTDGSPSEAGGILAVVTRLTHAETSEYVEITIPIPIEQPTAQKVGSATTYGRRYGLETLLGLAEADDDGHGASQRKPANGHTGEREPDWQAVSDRMRGEIAATKTVSELEEWGQANASTKDQMPKAVGDRINDAYVNHLDNLEAMKQITDPQAPLEGMPDLPDGLRREPGSEG